MSDTIGKENVDIYSLPVTTIRGEETTFGAIAGDKVALVVNVASRCGHTPQYAQLEELQQKYGEQGFTVIGFPSNQFLQEMGSEEDIAEYCSATWGTTFPMTSKVSVNGSKTHPVFKELKLTADAEGKAGRVAWNFEKFLISPDGQVARFRPPVLPDDPAIVEQIEAWLPK
ncbi:MAG: glutathione peroxidase [Microbacteriaceae bacterium]|nr:glutathione peroxidase [Microbacteriaceae bacterium]